VSNHQLSEQLKEETAAREEAQRILAQRDELLAQKDCLIASLTARIKWLEDNLFGVKSEKNVILPPAATSQLDVFGPQEEATAEEAKEESKDAVAPRVRRPKPRQPIPANLPRRRVVHDLPEAEKSCSCCGNPKTMIGEDVSEKLEIVPAQFTVTQHVRPRYACNCCKNSGISQAPLPAFPIQRAAAAPSLLAYLLLAKYADHMPLCRLERLFERHGIDMPRSKTSAWMMEIAALLRPLHELMIRRVTGRSAVIGADETPIKMLDPASGKHRTKQCYLWEYRGDELAPYTVFDFRESRGREGPLKILAEYKGFLQCDAYAVYASLRRKEGLGYTQVGCWAHARRKFVETLAGGDDRARGAIEIIQGLYGIEKKVKDLSNEERQIVRGKESVAVLARLREWLEARLDALPGSPLGKAVGYALDNSAELTVYTTDGRLPIDNNAVERSIRPIAIGRKNWLFAGSERGGEAAAIFFTIIESARRANANLWQYIKDLLHRLPGHPVNRLEELLPDRWQQSQE